MENDIRLDGDKRTIVIDTKYSKDALKAYYDRRILNSDNLYQIFAYVKNMSKDGSFYWVFAQITPDFGPKGDIVGYYSVRRCPRRSAIDKIVPVYQQMLAAEKAAGSKDAIAAGTKVLTDLLQSSGMSYEQLVLSL